uniref:Retrotransposon gag domain-containing protein n=1 Tax=Nicotiana tabacum TaxID=4097 RepID=A0A1S4D556_TOBAC
MADKFVTTHVGTKKAEARVNDIFTVRKTPGEGLRNFLVRFNRMRMSLVNVSEGMAVAAFQNGLSRNGLRATRKLVRRLMKYPPTTWEKIHNAYCAEVRADEDDLNGPIQWLALVQAQARKDLHNVGRRDQLGPRLGRERHQTYIRGTIAHPPQHMDGPPRHITTPPNERGMPSLLSAHNICVSPSEIVYALEKLDTKERGHKIEDYIGLRQEVVRMLNQGHLRELISDWGRANFARGRGQHQGPPKLPSPARTIQMIIGGGGGTAINHVKFTTTHKLKRSITLERYDNLEDSIVFNKLDTDDLSFPHYDALVITLHIADTDMKRIMVDDGSGACIIHPRVLAHMWLE